MKNKPKGYTLGKMLKDYAHIFEHFGMNDENILDHFGTWAKDRPPLVGDYLWYIFNMLIDKNRKITDNDKDFHLRSSMLYAAMVDFRRRIERASGASINKLQKQQLLSLLQSSAADTQNLKCSVEVISGKCCEFCNSLDGQIFELETIINGSFLASENCTREFGCNCTYTLLPDRDANGRLIFSK